MIFKVFNRRRVVSASYEFISDNSFSEHVCFAAVDNGVDFIGDLAQIEMILAVFAYSFEFVGGEFDVVLEGFLGLVAGDVHHRTMVNLWVRYMLVMPERRTMCEVTQS